MLQNRSSIVLLLFIRQLIKIMTIVKRSKYVFIDQDFFIETVTLWRLNYILYNVMEYLIIHHVLNFIYIFFIRFFIGKILRRFLRNKWLKCSKNTALKNIPIPQMRTHFQTNHIKISLCVTRQLNQSTNSSDKTMYKHVCTLRWEKMLVKASAMVSQY